MFLRTSLEEKLLLLNDGTLALGDYCGTSMLYFYTQGMQHPDCLEIMVNGRDYWEITPPPAGVSRAWEVAIYPGEFSVTARWASGHFPYPEIEDIAGLFFGVSIPAVHFPIAPGGYQKMADIVIDKESRVKVNGIAGRLK